MVVAAPSARALLLGWSLDPVVALTVVVAAMLYAYGVRRLAGRGRRWPAGRTAAFGAGLALVAVATQSGLARYDGVLFSAHVAQHVALGMAAPLLLALGAPVTLALQATGGAGHRVLLRVAQGPVIAGLTHPGVAGALVGGSLFGLYFTPLFELSLSNRVVHAAVHAHFLAAGCAFFWPLVGLDAGRRRLPHGLRMLCVLLIVPVHAVLGLAILSSRELLAGGWYVRAGGATLAGALADQQTAGGLLWVTGDLVGLVAAGVVLAQWMGHEAREGAREDRRLDVAEASRARAEAYPPVP